jgi:antitoxin component HigA of HigAB toxin-antitoxin module
MSTPTPVEVIEAAIAQYGRTNEDPLWRHKEAEFVLASLRSAGYHLEEKK